MTGELSEYTQELLAAATKRLRRESLDAVRIEVLSVSANGSCRLRASLHFEGDEADAIELTPAILKAGDTMTVELPAADLIRFA
jgi:hypothetical protein